MAAPDILWRCTRHNGSEAKCVLVPGRPVNSVVWYLNNVVQGVREFDDVDEARQWDTTTLWLALALERVTARADCPRPGRAGWLLGKG